MPEIAAVAGGSAGIGRAAVIAFARRGYWVGVLARDPERLESVCTGWSAVKAILSTRIALRPQSIRFAANS